jgi:alcohol dehydrogenase, propanol-preferring
VDAPLGEVRLVYPWVGCGRCDRCAAGHDNDCLKMQTLGLFHPGGYATHILVPHPRYLLEVDGLEPSYACTLACAGVTAYGALLKVTLPYEGDALVLIGAGGVGLTAVGMARSLFDRPIVVVDKDEAKLEAALAAGATHAIHAGERGIPRQIMKLAGGAGGVVDFVGSPETLQLGLDVLLKGGSLVVVGLHGGDWPLPIPLLPLRNVSLVGTLTGTVEETREAIALVRNRPVPRVPVTERPLAEATQALEDLEGGRVVGRTVLVP